MIGCSTNSTDEKIATETVQLGALVGDGAGLVGGALTGNNQVEIASESPLTFTLSGTTHAATGQGSVDGALGQDAKNQLDDGDGVRQEMTTTSRCRFQERRRAAEASHNLIYCNRSVYVCGFGGISLGRACFRAIGNPVACWVAPRHGGMFVLVCSFQLG